jgi:acyl-CoA thioester hydrolase
VSEQSTFAWPVRVYYEDTDAGGVVYHGNYLKFCERARTEWLRSLGFEQTDLVAQHGLVFVVRSAAVKYLRPAKFNDELTVLARIARLGRCAFEFEQEVWRNEERLVTAQVEVVCVTAVGFKPVSIPEHIRNKIQEFA